MPPPAIPVSVAAPSQDSSDAHLSKKVKTANVARPIVYFEVAIDGRRAGRIVIEVRGFDVGVVSFCSFEVTLFPKRPKILDNCTQMCVDCGSLTFMIIY